MKICSVIKSNLSLKGYGRNNLRTMILTGSLLTGLLVQLSCTGRPSPKDYLQETRAERDARMAWWREARFGMFIHWGLYAVPASIWKGEERFVSSCFERVDQGLIPLRCATQHKQP